MNTKIITTVIILLLISSSLTAKGFPYKRQIVKTVEIEGNKHFSDSKLKSQLLTKPNRWHKFLKKRRLSRTNVLIDKKQLERFYGQNGFLFTEIEATADFYRKDSSMAVALFSINEGKRVNVDTMGLYGGLDNLNKDLTDYTKKIKPGQPVNHDAVLAATYKIRDYYADNGYPFVSIRPQYIYSGDSSNAIVYFNIAESSYVYNGEIEIIQEGRVYTKESIYRRELVIKPGETYSRKLNVESQQRLYSTGLLKFVTLKRTGDLEYIGADTAITKLKLYITGRKPSFVNFRFGIDQDEDFNSVLQTSVSWGSRNIWGTGRRLSLTVSNSIQLAKRGEEQERAITIGDLFSDLELKPVKNAIEAKYVEPWFLSYRMPLSLSAIYEPQNKDPILNKFYDRLSGETALTKLIGKYTNLKFSARIEFVDIHGVRKDEEADYRLQGDNSIRRRLSVYGNRDTRDNIFAPQKGSYSYTSLEYVGHYLGGDFNYIKGEFSWSRYKYLFGENILASRFRIGALKELGNFGRSSIDDRFTLGGAKTVRGFAENEIGPKFTDADSVTSSLLNQPKGGKLLLLANFELRRPLFWRFGGSVFIDIGNVFFDIENFKANKVLSTTGLGLQFFTPVGPVRFEYAFLLQKELDLGEGSYHLTLLYAF